MRFIMHNIGIAILFGCALCGCGETPKDRVARPQIVPQVDEEQTNTDSTYPSELELSMISKEDREVLHKVIIQFKSNKIISHMDGIRAIENRPDLAAIVLPFLHKLENSTINDHIKSKCKDLIRRGKILKPFFSFHSIQKFEVAKMQLSSIFTHIEEDFDIDNSSKYLAIKHTVPYDEHPVYLVTWIILYYDVNGNFSSIKASAHLLAP
jgi:hypothetical protein